MKHLIQRTKKLSFVAAFLMSATVSTAHAGDVLTGDTRLACEAILCLSSGVRPGECNPSLDRYFGIHHKYWSDTVRARLNFLNLCPAGKEPGMSDRISSIAHGAGRCDADFLNANNFKYKYVEYEQCGKESCRTSHRQVKVGISDVLPKYCGAYNNHEWSYELGLKYVGKPETGGHWVAEKDYPTEMEKYNRRMEELAKTRTGRKLLKRLRENSD